MQYQKILIPDDLNIVEAVIKSSFASTTDSSLEEWLSLSVMKEKIKNSEGICLKAVNEENKIAGIIYAQQENPINGIEGTEKWVIIVSAILPEFFGKGIGSGLLKEIEKQAKDNGAKKMFVFTNKSDEKVINFYKKNSYEDAGTIKDYQYGEDNSAIFLLKYL